MDVGEPHIGDIPEDEGKDYDYGAKDQDEKQEDLSLGVL